MCTHRLQTRFNCPSVVLSLKLSLVCALLASVPFCGFAASQAAAERCEHKCADASAALDALREGVRSLVSNVLSGPARDPTFPTFLTSTATGGTIGSLSPHGGSGATAADAFLANAGVVTEATLLPALAAIEARANDMLRAYAAARAQERGNGDGGGGGNGDESGPGSPGSGPRSARSDAGVCDWRYLVLRSTYEVEIVASVQAACSLTCFGGRSHMGGRKICFAAYVLRQAAESVSRPGSH